MIVHSQGESGQFQVSSCPKFLWQASYVGHRNEGVEYSLGGKDVGVILPDFHPSSIFQRKEGFISLFNLDWKCHGIGA